MIAVAATLTCSTLASLGALARLRAVCRATTLDPTALAGFVRAAGHAGLQSLARDEHWGEAEGWEAELIRGVAEAPSEEHARAALNEALFEADTRLDWGARIPATCARVALSGALLAGVLLLAREARLTMEVVDVVALGAAGAIIASTIGAEAGRVARLKRASIDGLADRVLAVRGYLTVGEPGSDSDVEPKVQ